MSSRLLKGSTLSDVYLVHSIVSTIAYIHPVTYTPFLVNFVIWFFVVLAFVQHSVINDKYLTSVKIFVTMIIKSL